VIAPATLNKHSTLAVVVGMLRNLRDRRRSVGKSFDCVEIRTIQVRQWSGNWR